MTCRDDNEGGSTTASFKAVMKSPHHSLHDTSVAPEGGDTCGNVLKNAFGCIDTWKDDNNAEDWLERHCAGEAIDQLEARVVLASER